MKIIKEGWFPKEPREFRGECRLCHCQIECSEDEVKWVEVYGEWIVKCPTENCVRYIVVKELIYR